MEDSERIEEAIGKMRRNDKLSVVYGKQDLHYFMNQSRPEGLSDQQSTGPRLRFVSISEIVQEQSKNPELEENKDIFEDEGYDLSEKEQMNKAQKSGSKESRQGKEIPKSRNFTFLQVFHSSNSRGLACENEQRTKSQNPVSSDILIYINNNYKTNKTSLKWEIESEILRL